MTVTRYLTFSDILTFFWGGQADGVTTSDTMNSWGASSDRSEVDSKNNSLKRHSGGEGADGHQPLATSKAEEGRGGREGGHGVSKSTAVVKERRDMLFVSGMMGVKRRSLSTLRYGIDLHDTISLCRYRWLYVLLCLLQKSCLLFLCEGLLSTVYRVGLCGCLPRKTVLGILYTYCSRIVYSLPRTYYCRTAYCLPRRIVYCLLSNLYLVGLSTVYLGELSTVYCHLSALDLVGLSTV